MHRVFSFGFNTKLSYSQIAIALKLFPHLVIDFVHFLIIFAIAIAKSQIKKKLLKI